MVLNAYELCMNSRDQDQMSKRATKNASDDHHFNALIRCENSE
jgi:hypothetical protein